MCKLLTLPTVRIGFLLVCIIVFVARLHRLWSVFPISSNDLADPFLGAMMLVRHQSPFDVNSAFQKSYEYPPYSRHWHNFLYPILYPPSTLLVLAPLTVIRYGAVNVAWFFAGFAIYCAGIFVLIRTVFPKLHLEYALSFSLLAVLPTYVGFNVDCDQFGAVLAGLCFLFIASEISGNRALSWWCATIVMCMKLTFAAPIVGIYLLQRRFNAFAGAAAVVLILNVWGFLMAGGLSAVRQYAHSIAVYDRAPTNSIDPRTVHGLDRTDFEYLAMGVIGNEEVAKASEYLVDIAGVVIIGILGMRLMRSADRTAAICVLSGPLVVLTLLGVYHQRYDLTLLIAPAVMYFYVLNRRLAGWAAILFLVLAVLQSFYDIDRFGHVLIRIGFLPAFFPKLVVSALLALQFGTSLLVLRESVAASERGSKPSTAAEPALA